MPHTRGVIDDHVLLGYRVASRADRAQWQDDSLPANGLVSMSGCVVDLVSAVPNGWDEWFGDPGSANRALRPGMRVLGVGIAATDVDPLLEDIADGGWDQAAGSVPDRLARRVPLPPNDPFGFEVIGYDSGRWHTWTCLGGLVAAVEQATGILPGEHGLVQDERQARRAADWLTTSNLGDPKVFHWVAALLFEVQPGRSDATSSRQSVTSPGMDKNGA
jgi:hypothetical protein